MNKLTLAVLLSSSVLAACGQIFFKIGASGASSLLSFINLRVIVGLACYGLSTLMWIWSLSKAPLVYIYPFTMLTFVLVYAGSMLLLREKFPVSGMFGILLILAGLFFVVRSSAA